MKLLSACVIAQLIIGQMAFAKTEATPSLKELCVKKIESKQKKDKKWDAKKVCSCYVEKMSFIPKEDEALLKLWLQDKASSEELKKKSHSLLDANYHAEEECIEN
jgi:hypothetical protein